MGREACVSWTDDQDDGMKSVFQVNFLWHPFFTWFWLCLSRYHGWRMRRLLRKLSRLHATAKREQEEFASVMTEFVEALGREPDGQRRVER